MTFSWTTVIIVVVFVLIALAVIVGVGIGAVDVFAPLINRITHGMSVRDWLEEHVPHRSRRSDDDDDDEEENDDLDDATAALLAMLPDVPIVVDNADEVVRANPEAYRLGIVDDDVISNEQIARAVQKVRETGKRVDLELSTTTPTQFSALEESDDDIAVQSAAVVRPNWLKISIGRISEQFIVILVTDVSETVRFHQVRNDFITNVSQQLITPSSELKELSRALEQDNLSESQIKEDAKKVRQSIEHIDHMIADLLLLIQAQEPIEPSENNQLHVNAVIQQTVDELQPVAQLRGQRIVIRAKNDVYIHGQSEQIQAAVRKLIENALRYSDDNAAVSVVITKSADNNDAVIKVIDRGAGIPEQEQPRIFERFYRGANQNIRTDDGVGLGLSIVKHVALTHHGGVQVWSKPNQGSTFSLILPLSEEQSAAEPAIVGTVEPLPDEQTTADNNAKTANIG